jgi:pyroglutamyl-peptidase
VLPGIFERSIQCLYDLIARHDPDVVLCFGQAWGRAEITVERVAINLTDSWGRDNAERQPIDEPVIADGPSAYWSCLPVKDLVAAMQEAGVPAAVSYDAGTHLCNHVFYALMHYIAGQARPLFGGLIHVPWLPSQLAALGNSNVPTMALATQKQAVQCVLRVRRDRVGNG